MPDEPEWPSPLRPDPRGRGKVVARVTLPVLVLLPIAPFVAGLFFVIFGLLPIVMEGDWSRGLELGAALGFEMAALVLAGSCLYALTSPVRVHEHGLSAYDPWDRRNQDFLHWDLMESVGEARFFRVRYLRVKAISSDGEVWIPLGLRDSGRFVAAVHDAAPAENPLRRYLEKSRPN